MAAMKKRFTLDDKRRILELYDQLPHMSQRKAAKRLNVTPTMLWSLIHNRNGVIKGEKIKRDKSRWIGCGRSPRLEANIWKWIDRMRREGTAINDLMIHRTSIVIAAQMGLVNFRPSPRWYSGFKKREAVVRERYSIYPNLDVKHQPELRVSQHTRCSASRAADAESPQEHSTQETQRETATVCETKQIPDQGNPRVLVGPVNGRMQSVTVPSLQQMQEAMKTVATGLLYRGFCDFKLLHQFEREVANVVRKSKVQGCQESFIA